MRTLTLSILASLLTACSTMAPTEKVAELDYGPEPTNYEEVIKQKLLPILKDPMSAQYNFQKPFKGYTRKAPISGGGISKVGWVVRVYINAKNSYGGYIGFKEYQFLFRDNVLVEPFIRNNYFKEEWLWEPMLAH